MPAPLKPNPDFPMAHPGQLLRDDLGELGTSKTELAQRLGITRKMLYDILNGTSAVTAPMALKLEAVVGSSAEFWLGMQMQHDLWKARQAAKPRRAVKAAKRAKAA
jgi:addiction module HigA family antidote